MFFKDTILKDAVMKVFSYSLILLLICYFFSPFAYCGEENTLPSSIKAGDLSMSVDDCIDTALKNNYDLYSETLVLDKFYRALEEQNNGRLPEIYFEYINRGAAIFDAADYLSSEAGFRITQPIYHGGEITYNQEEALLNYEKELFYYKSLEDNVIYEAYVYYYDLARQNKLLEISYADLERADLLLSISEARFKAGDIAEIEVLKAEVQVAQSQDTIISTEAAKENAQDRLTRFLELPVGTVIIPEEEITYAPFALTLEECIKIAVNNKPELQSALLDIKTAEIALEKVKNDILPEIDLVSTLKYRTQTDVVAAENYQLFLNATWEFPVYDRGQRSNQLQDKEADIEIEKINYDQLEKDVVLKVRNAYRTLKTLESRIELRQKIVEQAEQNQIATQLQYETGFATILEVTTTSQELTRAKINALEALIDYQLAKENLVLIMGVIGQDVPEGNEPEILEGEG